VSRRGSGLLALLVLAVLVLGGSLGVLGLARQARRSSDWFLDAQRAHNLADAALREALLALDAVGAGGPAPVGAGELDGFFAPGGPGRAGGELELFTSDPRPPALQATLDALADQAPRVRVRLVVGEVSPLWTGSLRGVPADQAERQGRLRLEAVASVAAPERRITRSLTAARSFKRVQLLPPVVGRFVAFVRTHGGQDPNGVEVRADLDSGESIPVGAARPLDIRPAPEGISLMTPGAHRLDHGSVAELAEDFLDRHGWVFLGAEGQDPWRLHMTQGYGEDVGASHLWPADLQPVAYGQDEEDQEAFYLRVEDSFGPGGYGACDVAIEEGDGLFHQHHGMAVNYPWLGLPAAAREEVGPVGGSSHAFDIGPRNRLGSLLRIFGPASEVSPTLVFGPVRLATIRRVGFQLTLLDEDIPCDAAGPQYVNLFRLEDEEGDARTALLEVFEGEDNFREKASKRATRPLAQALSHLLDPRVEGEFGEGGELLGRHEPPDPLAADPGAGREYASALLPGLPAVRGGRPLEAAALDQLWRAEVDVDALYAGELSDGLGAFREVFAARLARTEGPDVPLATLARGGVLDLPGVVRFSGAAPRRLPAISRVRHGGVLAVDGDLHVTGDVVRGPAGERAPPLTLVSLAGDVIVDPGVRRVDAHLVALRGKVVLAAEDLVVTGGVAADRLDLEPLRRGGTRRLVYAPDQDPASAEARRERYRLVLEGAGTAVGGSAS
jgi:hypothetical protein